MKTLKLLSTSLMIAAAISFTAQAQIAADDASNYSGGWTNGSNGGSGFGAWDLSTGGDATLSIANPADSGISGMPAESFRLTGSTGYATANRDFSEPMSVGNIFRIQWGNNWDTNGEGNKGVNLYAGGSSSGTQLININMGGSSTITINGQPMFSNYGVGAITIYFEYASASSLRVSATGRDGVETYDNTFTISGAPDGIRLYAGNMQADVNRYVYANLLEIDGTQPELSFTAGDAAPAALGDIAFTLERSSGGPVDDDIVLSSDNTSVVTVPASVAFDGSDTLVFTGTVVSLSSGPATITASNVTSGASATFTVTPIAPSLEISGPTYLNEGAKATYTLTRSLSVGPTVNLVVDWPDLVDHPATVTFDGSATFATFVVTATGLAESDIFTLSATNAEASDDFDVEGVAAPAGIYDDASYYDSFWFNGDNRGAGFGDWALTNSNGGAYIGSATNQGPNHAALDVGGVSFGLYGQGFSEALRPLGAGLGIGDTLSFSVGFKFDDGNRGFDLNAGASQVFNLNINDTGYQWTGGNTNAPTPWQDAETNNVRAAGVVLDVEILATATGFDYDISSAQDTNLVISGSVVSGSAVDAVKFYVSGAGAGTDSDFFFNTLQVNDVPDPDTLSVSGIDAMALITNVFTVSRTGSTNDAVTVILSSSDTNALVVPADVEIPAGEASATFEVVGTGLGVATIDLTATGYDAADFQVMVFDIAYDDTQYYNGTWADGSNGGGGFGAWTLANNNDGVTNFAGSFIDNSTLGGPQVNDPNGQAFGLYANGEAAPLSEALRGFPELQVGQSVHVNIGVNYLNGSKGVQFWNDDGASNRTLLAEVAFYEDGYWFENKSAGSPAQSLGWGYAADSAIEVMVSRLEGNFYSVELVRTGSNPESNLVNNVVFTSAPNTIRFYAYDNDPGDDANNLYFNRLAVFTGTIGEVVPTLNVSGPSFVMEDGIATYRVTRVGGVGDEVFLSSSDTNALSVLGSVTFGVDEDTVLFKANGLLEATGVTITATNSDAVSNSYEVDVAAAPTNLVDVAANYDNSWFDGDKSGAGFGPWTFNVDPASGFAGAFIGNPVDGGIAGMDAQSFGFYANPVGSGANAEVARALESALDVGLSLSFQWGLNFDSGDAGSSRGFSLYSGATEVLNINMTDSEIITIGTNTMLSNYGVNAITVTITHETAGNLRVTATGRDGVESFTSDLIPVAGAPDNFKFYFNAASDNDAQRQMYVNNLAITEGGEGPELPTDLEITTLTISGGSVSASFATEVGLHYYLVYAFVPLNEISVNPIDIFQWIAVKYKLGTGNVEELIDDDTSAPNRIYGILIRSEPMDN